MNQNYYLLVVYRKGLEPEVGNLTYYATQQEALAAFYAELADKFAVKSLVSCFCMVITSTGSIVKQERLGQTSPIVPPSVDVKG